MCKLYEKSFFLQQSENIVLHIMGELLTMAIYFQRIFLPGNTFFFIHNIISAIWIIMSKYNYIIVLGRLYICMYCILQTTSICRKTLVWNIEHWFPFSQKTSQLALFVKNKLKNTSDHIDHICYSFIFLYFIQANNRTHLGPTWDLEYPSGTHLGLGMAAGQLVVLQLVYTTDYTCITSTFHCTGI